jgi:transposase
MFIKRLKPKKKKSNASLFRRQVVEYYRADILSARQLAKELPVSINLLRGWNRRYFKLRLLRHFKSRLSFAMKNKEQLIKKFKTELV